MDRHVPKHAYVLQYSFSTVLLMPLAIGRSEAAVVATYRSRQRTLELDSLHGRMRRATLKSFLYARVTAQDGRQCRATCNDMPVLLLVVLAILPGVLLGQSDRVPTGCFDVSVGPWDPTAHISIDSVLFEPPSRVRLSRDIAYRRPSWRRLDVAPNALPSPHRSSSWRWSRDTLHVAWSTGFVGLSAVLSLRDESWTGVARSFGDVMPWPVETRPIELTPTPCDAPLLKDSSSDTRLPRALPLAGAGQLELGSPLPQFADSVRVSAGRLVTGTIMAGDFADAESVRINVDDSSRIAVLVVRFPPSISFDSVAARMTNLLGPPQSEQHRGVNTSLSWLNRTTSWFIAGRPESPSETIVMVRDPRLR